MTTTPVQYVGPFDEIEIAATGDYVKRLEIIDVDAELAGHPPIGEPGDDDYDAGAGLLAQHTNWIPGELEAMTIDALKSYADKLEVDLAGATTKPQIVKAIRKAAESEPIPDNVGDAGIDQE